MYLQNDTLIVISSIGLIVSDKLVELKLDISTDSIREGRWLCHKDTLGFLGKSNLL